jgi:hypothetical protein
MFIFLTGWVKNANIVAESFPIRYELFLRRLSRLLCMRIRSCIFRRFSMTRKNWLMTRIEAVYIYQAILSSLNELCAQLSHIKGKFAHSLSSLLSGRRRLY